MSSPLRFDSRTVIVTGGAGGLGAAYVRDLAARGARVLINDVGTDRSGSTADSTAAEQLAEEVNATGGVALPDHTDLREPGAEDRLVERVLDEWGRVDHLISNAGIWRDRTAAKMSDDEFNDVLDVHLGSSFRLTRAALQAMRGAGGSVVLTGSTAGLFGTFGQVNYAAAKAGVVGVARVAALEGASHGVRTNVVVPVAATRSGVHPVAATRFDGHDYRPEHVASLVTALLHPSCAESGGVWMAGGGWYSNASWTVGQGWATADLVSAEEIRQHWTAIKDPSQVSPIHDGFEVFEVIDAAVRRTGPSV